MITPLVHNSSWHDFLQSIQFEYALRTLGSGGPGMHSAWLLRESLRKFIVMLQDLSPDELFREDRTSAYSIRLYFYQNSLFIERGWLIFLHVFLDVDYELSPYVDGLPASLWDLSKVFTQLEQSLLDYVALYHSVYLGHLLQLLSEKLKVRFESHGTIRPLNARKSRPKPITSEI